MDSTPTTQQKKFGKYIIESELGRGGMGVVYKAYDLQLQRHVALKILININQKSIRRLQNESVAMANIDHPNITRFYEFGSSPQPHFAMEFIEGITLKTLIIQKKVKQLFLINTLMTICNCLQEIHDKKILHRDLKPENIMIAKDGTPKIMDFGLAKFTNDHASDLSKTGDIVGTVHYMAPEQISGNVRIASDIYAIGATMYEALTFQKLFDGVSQANLIFQVLQVDPIPPREINSKISVALEEDKTKVSGKDTEKIKAYTTEFTFLGKTSNKVGELTFRNGELQYLHVGGRQKNRGYGINSGFGRERKYFRKSSEQFLVRGESFFAYLNPRNIIDGAGTVTYILQK